MTVTYGFEPLVGCSFLHILTFFYLKSGILYVPFGLVGSYCHQSIFHFLPSCMAWCIFALRSWRFLSNSFISFDSWLFEVDSMMDSCCLL